MSAPLDRLFQQWRSRTVRPHIPPGARVLDIGCGDGSLFRLLRSRIREGVGIDSDLAEPRDHGYYRLMPGRVPEQMPAGLGCFDAITMLAVLEHIPPRDYAAMAGACAGLLVPRGRLVITVPSPAVDHILHALKWLPFLYEGRSLEQHHGFEPADTPGIFSAFRVVVAKKFQLGLNNLFVLERP